MACIELAAVCVGGDRKNEEELVPERYYWHLPTHVLHVVMVRARSPPGGENGCRLACGRPLTDNYRLSQRARRVWFGYPRCAQCFGVERYHRS